MLFLKNTKNKKILINNYGEGVTRNRTLENLDEPIRTDMTPYVSNLPTKLPTICLNVINYKIDLRS